MVERERLLKQLHSELYALHEMDSFPEEGVYEENFKFYAFNCMIQGFITERLFKKYRIPFPDIPYPCSLRKGVHNTYYYEIHKEFSSLDLNDCFFAFENLGLSVCFLGVDLEDREHSINELPKELRDLIRKRWVFFGKDIYYVEMDMVIEIPGLPAFYKSRKAGQVSSIEQSLFDLCLQVVPNQLYALNPVLLFPEGYDSGYIHILQYYGKESPFTSSCYISRALFLAVYILTVLCKINTVPLEGGM